MDFNYIRRNSLFSPPTQPGINPSALSITPDMMGPQGGQQQLGGQQQAQQVQQPPNPSTLTDAYREMMNAQSGPANQRYKDFLANEAPQKDDFKPTKMNRLSAVLAGASTGIQQGGAEGFKAAQGVLDEPFNDAMSNYKLRASKLEAGAGLEDKETNNKVKTYRDFITDEQNKRKDDIALKTLGETHEMNQARIGNYNNLAATRETPQQRMDRALGTANATGKARVEGAKSIFDYEQPRKTADALKLINSRFDSNSKLQDQKFENIKALKQYVADNIAPDKYDHVVGKDGFVYGINRSDPTDVIKSTIDTGKLPPDQLAALRLKNSKELKASPGAAKKTETTTTVSGNKRTTTSTTTPEGANVKVDVIGPDGETGKMSVTELEEAQKHGWKKK